MSCSKNEYESVPNADVSGRVDMEYLERMESEMDLFEASRIGNLECVREFIKNGVDIEEKNNELIVYPNGCSEKFNGYTPLMIASEKNHFEIVKVLVEASSAKKSMDMCSFTSIRLFLIIRLGQALLTSDKVITGIEIVGSLTFGRPHFFPVAITLSGFPISL